MSLHDILGTLWCCDKMPAINKLKGGKLCSCFSSWLHMFGQNIMVVGACEEEVFHLMFSRFCFPSSRDYKPGPPWLGLGCVYVCV
jgi:hypothetical protein